MPAVPRPALFAALIATLGASACGASSREPAHAVAANFPFESDAGDLPPAVDDAGVPDAARTVTSDAGGATASVDEPSVGDDPSGPEEDVQAPQGDLATGATRPHAPVLLLTDAQLAAKVRTDLISLGSMSVGRTNAGALINGIPLPESPYWERVSPDGEWCTEETRDYLTAALAVVHAKYPDSPKVFVGNVSTRFGGFFPPHVSHQSGRDVDVGYFLTVGHAWYATATANNLDYARTWAFVRALVTETDLEYLFMEAKVQIALRNYALSIGEDRAWVDSLFQYGGGSSAPLIVHVRGHATHLHARFRSPVAEELGRRAYPFLLRRGLVRLPSYFVKHIAKKGETLSHLAVHYKVTVETLRKANNLKNDNLREGKEYRIPQQGGAAIVPPVLVLARRIPPPNGLPLPPAAPVDPAAHASR